QRASLPRPPPRRYPDTPRPCPPAAWTWPGYDGVTPQGCFYVHAHKSYGWPIRWSDAGGAGAALPGECDAAGGESREEADGTRRRCERDRRHRRHDRDEVRVHAKWLGQVAQPTVHRHLRHA